MTLLFEAFAQFAQHFPDHPAIVTGDACCSYGELLTRIRQISAALRLRNMHKKRIGLYFERGLDPISSIAGLLGIIQAGTVVPLEATLPAHRFTAMLEDAQIELIVSCGTLPPRLRAQSLLPVPAVSIEELLQPAIHEEQCGEEVGTLPAYLLYTSGSMGHPKGIIVGRASLLHFIERQNAWLGISPQDRCSHFFSLSFDASWSDLSVLWAGATLYPVPPEAILGGTALFSFLQKQALTVATATPSVWGTLPDTLGQISALRLIVMGGEPIPPSLPQRLSRSGLTMINAYGLTETTVCCALSKHSSERLYPLDGTIFSIRDEQLIPVPANNPGELCVAGESLAEGYTDANLTQERFFFDHGIRFLRTYDRAIQHPDGSIVLLGRIHTDRRMKLAGKLIDLDEIEVRLQALPSVKEAVVEALDHRIVAYIVPASAHDHQHLPSQLHRKLQQDLFDYMCPRAYMVLDQFPRTAHDKIDRVALRLRPFSSSMFVVANNQQARTAITTLERGVAEVVVRLLHQQAETFANLLPEETRQPLDPGHDWKQIDMAQAATEQALDNAPYSLITSLQAAEFVSALFDRYGFRFSPREVFTPLAEIAQTIALQQKEEAVR